MSATTASVSLWAPAHEARSRMLAIGADCLPVFEGALLVGIVTLEAVGDPELGLEGAAVA